LKPAEKPVDDEKQSKTQLEKERKRRQKAGIKIDSIDVIKDLFWEQRPWILSGRTGKPRE
jgi:tRNA(His) guanylyltransferase